MTRSVRRSARSLFLVGAAAAVALLSVAPASAGGTLRGDYRFEGGFRSSVAGPPRLVVEGEAGSFLTKTVWGQRDGVWRWQEGSGLLLDPASSAFGPGPGTYSVVMLVRLDDIDGYAKLVHVGALDDDAGFYVDDGELAAYPYGRRGGTVAADTWYQIAITRSRDGIVTMFVDGERALRVNDDVDRDLLIGVDDVVRFLRDDTATSGEETGGAIARLWIYDGALTTRQVARLAR